jgi:lysozyme
VQQPHNKKEGIQMSIWKWCLLKDDNTLATGWQKVGDYWYFMDSNGTMKTSWYQDQNSKWYYLKDNGQMATGWIQYNDKWYYLYEATNAAQGEYIGTTAYSCTKILSDGKSYTFDKDGVWIENTNILSDNGADFIGSWEGLWLKADYDPIYPGVDKYMTIGYGTTKETLPEAFPDGINSTCTKEQAREWLIYEGRDKAETIKSDLDNKNISLKQYEMDALISFAYNCGAGQDGLLGSTLYKNVVAGIRDMATITANFQAWSNDDKGNKIPGIYRRRTSEAALFLNGDYTGNV